MKIKLYQRRRRTLALLATSNSVASVVANVSDDYKCSEEAVNRDLNNIARWGKDFAKFEFNPPVSAGKLSILFRDAIDSLLSSKDEKFKHQARTDALAIVREQINLGNQLGAGMGNRERSVKQPALGCRLRLTPILWRHIEVQLKNRKLRKKPRLRVT